MDLAPQASPAARSWRAVGVRSLSAGGQHSKVHARSSLRHGRSRLATMTAGGKGEDDGAERSSPPALPLPGHSKVRHEQARAKDAHDPAWELGSHDEWEDEMARSWGLPLGHVDEANADALAETTAQKTQQSPDDCGTAPEPDSAALLAGASQPTAQRAGRKAALNPMPEAAMTDTLVKPRSALPSVITRLPLWQGSFFPGLSGPALNASGQTDAELYVCSELGCEPLSDALARLIALDERELSALEAMDDIAVEFSDEERRLYERAIDSLDYFGDWADPKCVKDSIVLACEKPCVMGGEYTCAHGNFKPDRTALHARIIGHMLPSTPSLPFFDDGSTMSPAPSAGCAGGQKRAYIVVGVPGSGKDSVIKRYLRRANVGVDLVDASADRLKGYLAQWGEDDLSREVRQHCKRHGYAKQLLHAQYLHRESIYVVQRLVERVMERGAPFMLEKTLYWLPQIVQQVQELRAAGYEVHLYGTLISPLKNWEFLNRRAMSGQSFGRLISKEQAVLALRRYQENLEIVLRDPTLGLGDGGGLSSVNLYDVVSGEWKLRLLVPQGQSSADESGGEESESRDASVESRWD